jgi:hypothetical protein
MTMTRMGRKLTSDVPTRLSCGAGSAINPRGRPLCLNFEEREDRQETPKSARFSAARRARAPAHCSALAREPGMPYITAARVTHSSVLAHSQGRVLPHCLARAQHGTIGLKLPRSVFSAAGSGEHTTIDMSGR